MITILLKLLDMVTTIFQCFLMVWACNNIASRENKISKFKFGLLVFIISSLNLGVTFSNIQVVYVNLLMVIVTLVCCIIFYRKSCIDAVLGFGIVYSMIVIAFYFLIAFYKYVLVQMKFSISADLQMILFVFVPSWLLYIIFFKFGKHIFNTIMLMKTYINSLVFFIIITYTLIVLDTLRVQNQVGKVNSIFRSVFYFVTFLVFVFVIVYFARINEKSKEVKLLNSALKEKITELRKVKHDYGSEISGLYGLYQLGKYDRLGDMLKNIVERNQSMHTSVYVNVQAASPLVNSILSPVTLTNIDMIVFDSAEYENLSLTDNELLKVLSNIIRNSVDALKDVKDPVIKFKSYNNNNEIIIIINNNGPEIPKDIKQKIFETGFSTKDNINGDRGYGLSIVKEIVNKCKGKITIDSDSESTQFNIEIPYKNI